MLGLWLLMVSMIAPTGASAMPTSIQSAPTRPESDWPDGANDLQGWRAGLVFRYRFTYSGSSQTQLIEDGRSTEDETTQTRLDAIVDFTVVAEMPDGGQLLQVQVREVDAESSPDDATDPERAPPDALKTAFFVVRSADGSLHDVLHETDAPAEFLNLPGGFVSLLQIVLRNGSDRYTVTETDSSGVYEASYSVSRQGELLRVEKQIDGDAYTSRAGGAPAVDGIDYSAATVAMLDPETQVLRSATRTDRLDYGPGDGPAGDGAMPEIAFRISGEGRIELVSEEPAGADAPRLEPGDIAQHERALESLLGVELSRSDLVAKLPTEPQSVLDGDAAALDAALAPLYSDPTSPAAILDLATAIAADSQGVAMLAERLARGTVPPSARSAVAAALIGVSSEAAQTLLMDEFLAPTDVEPEETDQLLALLTLLPEPSAATLEAVESLVDDERHRAQALLVSGAIASTMKTRDPNPADLLATRAEAALQAAMEVDEMELQLLVLGNLGLARSLPIIEDYLEDDSPSIRGAAIRALRKLDSPAVLPLIEAHLEASESELETSLLLGVAKQRQEAGLDSLAQINGDLLSWYWQDTYGSAKVNSTISARVLADGAPLAFMAEGSAKAEVFGTQAQLVDASVLSEPVPNDKQKFAYSLSLMNNSVASNKFVASCNASVSGILWNGTVIFFKKTWPVYSFYGVVNVNLTAAVGGSYQIGYSYGYGLCSSAGSKAEASITPAAMVYVDGYVSVGIPLFIRGGAGVKGKFLDSSLPIRAEATLTNSKLTFCYWVDFQMKAVGFELYVWYQRWKWKWPLKKSGWRPRVEFVLASWTSQPFSKQLARDCVTLFVPVILDGRIVWTEKGIFTVDVNGYLVRMYPGLMGWCTQVVSPPGVTLVRGSLVAGERLGANAGVYGVTTDGRIAVTRNSGTQVGFTTIQAMQPVVPGSLAYSNGSGLYFVSTKRRLGRADWNFSGQDELLYTWDRKIRSYSLVPSEGSGQKATVKGVTTDQDLFTTWYDVNNGQVAFAPLTSGYKIRPFSLAHADSGTHAVTKDDILLRVFWDTVLGKWQIQEIPHWGGKLTYSVHPSGIGGAKDSVFGVNENGQIWTTWWNGPVYTFATIPNTLSLMPGSLAVGNGSGVTGVKEDGSLVRAWFDGVQWQVASIPSYGYKAIGHSLDSIGTPQPGTNIFGQTTSGAIFVLSLANGKVKFSTLSPCKDSTQIIDLSGVDHHPLGAAELHTSANGIRVDGIGVSGEDGVLASFKPSSAYAMQFGRLVLTQPSAAISTRIFGPIDDEQQALLGTVELRNTGRAVVLSADPGASAARELRVEVWNSEPGTESQQIGSTTIAAGQAVELVDVRSLEAVEGRSWDGGATELRLRFEPSLQLMGDDLPLLGNEIRIHPLKSIDMHASIASQAEPASVDGLSGLSLQAAGTGSFDITESLATPPKQGRLANISTRSRVGTGDNILIGGFIVEGGPVRVAVRAIGPSLVDHGIADALRDPHLRLHDGRDFIAENDDWQQATNRSAIEAARFAPEDPRESVILVDLDPGAYTALVDGRGGGVGVGLVEVFHAGGDGELVNISSRAHVGTGADVLIPGIIVTEQATDVVVRALGPSLGARGVAGALADPTLVCFDGQTRIQSVDDWRDGPAAAEITRRGMAPDDPREAAVLLRLEPGAYTCHVAGADGTTGVGLVEVFKLR